jgi:hypothetical protein
MSKQRAKSMEKQKEIDVEKALLKVLFLLTIAIFMA